MFYKSVVSSGLFLKIHNIVIIFKFGMGKYISRATKLYL